MTFICKDFAYGTENPALIFIFIALLIRTNSLGYISCGRQKLTDLNEIESAWVVKFNVPFKYLPFEIAKIKPRKTHLLRIAKLSTREILIKFKTLRSTC